MTKALENELMKIFFYNFSRKQVLLKQTPEARDDGVDEGKKLGLVKNGKASPF
jgi:hypothetical protein